MKNPWFHAMPNKEYFRLCLMETSLYSVDFACASITCRSMKPSLACHTLLACWALPTPGSGCRSPDYTILDGDATKFSCTNVTQT